MLLSAAAGRFFVYQLLPCSNSAFAGQLPSATALCQCYCNRSSSNSSGSSSDSSSDGTSTRTTINFEEQYEDAFQEDESQQVVDKQQVLRQLIRRTHAAEAAMAHVLAGQQLALRSRPDATFFAQQEQEALASVKQLLPRYHVRPSALLPVLQGAGLAAGAAAALAPAGARDAVIAALQESLTGLYNDQLRLMREVGLTDEVPDVRAVLLRLRDLERAAEGAPPPPDLVSLQLTGSSGIGAAGIVGALVKAAADAAVEAAGKV